MVRNESQGKGQKIRSKGPCQNDQNGQNCQNDQMINMNFIFMSSITH